MEEESTQNAPREHFRQVYSLVGYYLAVSVDSNFTVGVAQ